jgi:hypothetical protein
MANGKRTPVDGPDFICIGLPKAGTAWLYDHLNTHPDFWMPPVKELLYLYRKQAPWIPVESRRGGGSGPRLLAGKERRRGPRPHELPRDRDLDLAFMEKARQCNEAPRDLGFYASLFQFKGTHLSGDISPIYAALDSKAITEVAERFSQAKLVLMVRDPVSRAWSRIKMLPSSKFSPALLLDETHLRSFLEGFRGLVDLSSPTQVVSRWREFAPNLPQKHVLLDDVSAEPEKTRADIWSYLGADPEKSSPLPADYNHKRRSGKPPKLEMTDIARSVLIDMFRKELVACAEMFGGRASAWPAKYGL